MELLICSQRMGRHPPAFIIHSVLVVIILAAMVAISLMYSMRADQTAAAAGEQSEQAWAVAMSGVEQVINQARQIVPGTLDWQNNPDVFQQQLVFDDGSDEWYHSIYSEGILEMEGIRYGLTDENGKYDLRYADSTALSQLLNAVQPPNDQNSQWAVYTNLVQSNLFAFSADLAAEMNAPGDSRTNRPTTPAADTSDTPRDTSSTPVPDFASASRSADSMAQLLDAVFVNAGHDIRLLYGKDVDLNFQVDGGAALTGVGVDPNAGGLRSLTDLGLKHFLTVVAYDPNLNSLGQPRLDSNDTNVDLATLNLPAATMTYIEAMRRENRKINHPADLLEASGKFKGDNNQEVELSSGVGGTELAVLLDQCTGTNASRLEGLINIVTAPKEVMMLLPGIDDALAESILAARQGLSPDQLQTTAWLVQQGLMEAESFKKIASRITSRSFQFHFHAVGYSMPAGRYRVLEAIIDVAANPPQILFLRDLTRLGMPFKVEASPLELTRRQRGRSLPTAAVKSMLMSRANRLSAGGNRDR